MMTATTTMMVGVMSTMRLRMMVVLLDVIAVMIVVVMMIVFVIVAMLVTVIVIVIVMVTVSVEFLIMVIPGPARACGGPGRPGGTCVRCGRRGVRGCHVVEAAASTRGALRSEGRSEWPGTKRGAEKRGARSEEQGVTSEASQGRRSQATRRPTICGKDGAMRDGISAEGEERRTRGEKRAKSGEAPRAERGE